LRGQSPRSDTVDTIPGDRVLVLATMNRGKARELVELLGDVPFDVRLLADYPGAVAPEETAATYRGNALLKARAAARLTGAWALGDDSGLEVDALDGAPGLRSARYGGPGLDDVGRCALLLDALRDVPADQRTARFRCVIALVDPEGRESVVEGVVDGTITRAPRGPGGFGYDPLFYYPPLGQTFGELSDAAKALVSHRARAAALARRVLTSIGKDQ
jgi:XTP/dITP diphosphohydrolase